MKKIACKELMDTTCEHVFEASSMEDLIAQANAHVSEEAHAADKAKMDSATEEEKAAWMNKVQAVWDAKADEPAAPAEPAM